MTNMIRLFYYVNIILNHPQMNYLTIHRSSDVFQR